MRWSGRVRVMAAFVAAVALHVLTISIWPSFDQHMRSESAIRIVGLYHEVASGMSRSEPAKPVSRQQDVKDRPRRETTMLPVPKQETKSDEVQDKIPVPVEKRDAPAMSAAGVNMPEVEMSVTSVADEDLPASVYAGIMAEVHYPRMARRNGWQGEVALRLDVRDRMIRQVTMLASSGYPLLDRAAYQGVGRIRTLPLADGFYRLPVIFRLQ